MESPTLLIVDDFDSIRDLVEKTLQDKGYRTMSASDGDEALAILQEHKDKIDLVLSDLNMPRMNGTQLLKEIREQEDEMVANIPFIILTTERDPKKMMQAKELGLSAWIKKPYNLKSFIAQIEHSLKMKS